MAGAHDCVEGGDRDVLDRRPDPLLFETYGAAPVERGGRLTFRRYPDGLLLSVSKSEVTGVMPVPRVKPARSLRPGEQLDVGLTGDRPEQKGGSSQPGPLRGEGPAGSPPVNPIPEYRSISGRRLIVGYNVPFAPAPAVQRAPGEPPTGFRAGRPRLGLTENFPSLCWEHNRTRAIRQRGSSFQWRLAVLALLALLSSFCTTIGFLPSKAGVRHARHPVAVFWQEREIQRPCRAIGLIIARSDLLGDESLMKQVLEKARSVGADAVIIRPQPGHRLDALAIRFTDE